MADIIVATRAESQRTPFLVTMGIFWLAAIDAPRRISLGPISLSGAMTIGIAALCVLMLPQLITSERYRSRLRRRALDQGQSDAQPQMQRARQHIPLTFTLFLLVAWIRLFIHPTSEGIQNVCVYTMFILGIGLVAVSAEGGLEDRIVRQIRTAGIFAAAIFLATNAIGIRLYAERSFALAELVTLAAIIPRRPTSLLQRLEPLIIIVAIASSLSRTALVTAVLMLAFSVVRGNKRFRTLRGLTALSLSVLTLNWLITSYEPISSRFTSGDNAMVAGININTSGRTEIWSAVFESAKASIWFGHGPGSAAALVNSRWVNVGHPHNDYLRLLHDFGLVGLSLFLFGFLTISVFILVQAHRTGEPIYWSAAMILFAIGATALTDNVIVYPFVMLPAAILIGLSFRRVWASAPLLGSNQQRSVDALPAAATRRSPSRRTRALQLPRSPISSGRDNG